MKQTRWICGQCQRQWVVWLNQLDTAADCCPVCKSQQIRQETYTALFPGADIGTNAADVPTNLPELPPTPPIDPRQVQINENQTLTMLSKDEELALSSPEFE